MKVTKPGKLPDLTLVGQCLVCGCEVECQPRDPEVKTETMYTQEDRWVQCPTEGCVQTITLEPKAVVEKRLRNEKSRWESDIK